MINTRTILLTLGMAIFVTMGASAEVIIDQAGVVQSGSWSSRTEAEHGGTYLMNGSFFSSTNGDTATANATLSAGTYAVQLWWPTTSAWTTNAPVTINHAGGSTTVRVNQHQNFGGGWATLGIYDFNAGSTSAVLTRESGNTNYSAFRFANVATDSDAALVIDSAGSALLSSTLSGDAYTEIGGGWTDVSSNNFLENRDQGTFDSGDTATYLADVTGMHKVELTWEAAGNRDSQALIRVTDSVGSYDFRVDQTVAASGGSSDRFGVGWYDLGQTFNFDGTAQVEIIRDGSSTGAVTVADGVKFVHAVIPEPATLGLLSLGGLALLRRRRSA